MPTPRRDETRDEFIARCIPIVLEEGTAQSNAQAVAVCNSMYDEKLQAELDSQQVSRGE